MGTFTLDPRNIRDIAPEALDEHGRLRVLPAAYWAGTTPDERALFGHAHGLYSFPTTELVEHLRALIAGRTAIEIGAGHGVLAEALGIPATDNRQQEWKRYRQVYERIGQPIVPYGLNVIDCAAHRAVRKYKPQVVIGCWVTHLYEPARHEAGGNEVGIDEDDIIRHCEAYVVVGNEDIHRGKKIWSRPHCIEYPPFVFSRAMNGARDFIASWGGRHQCTVGRGVFVPSGSLPPCTETATGSMTVSGEHVNLCPAHLIEVAAFLKRAKRDIAAQGARDAKDVEPW